MEDSLFRPFSKGKEGGHGLGLSIAKKIANMHHGDITLEPTTDGTTFKVVIGDVR